MLARPFTICQTDGDDAASSPKLHVRVPALWDVSAAAFHANVAPFTVSAVGVCSGRRAGEEAT
jgi:hypothetical protein